jgi:hypothetical protein
VSGCRDRNRKTDFGIRPFLPERLKSRSAERFGCWR